MTRTEMGNALRKMHDDGSKRREAKLMGHLFGIKYAREIEDSGIAKGDIAVAAGLPKKGYGTIISDGVAMARYVRLK